ncbi:ornithine decarboxylase [Ciona intestinalis]
MKQDRSVEASAVEIYPTINTSEIITSKILNDGREDHDDGFFICDLGDVMKKYIRWQKNFPRVIPHYAIKCNPDEILLKMLIGLGTGFDCASKSEIRQMLALGARPEQIIFANPCKQASHVRFARENNVKRIVFDNVEELVKMKKNFPTADLVLRIQTDDSKSICRFSMKYGAHPDVCKQLLDTAHKMNLNVVGISFHVGSGCQDVQAFVKALQNARILFDYAECIGYKFNLLDIGGGFPGTEDVDLKFEEIASVVNMTLKELFPIEEFPHVDVIAEPGRYFAASAYTLASNIIAKREVMRDVTEETLGEHTGHTDTIENRSSPTRCDEPAYMYYINDGLYGSFNCLFYDHAHVTPKLLKKPSEIEMLYSSSVWGPTCDGLDRICELVQLPQLDVGNWIVWEDMGAYTMAAGSSFNGFKTSKVYYVISDLENNLLQHQIAKKELPGVVFGPAFVDDTSSSEDEPCGDVDTFYNKQLSSYPGLVDQDAMYEACRIPVEV